MATPLRGGEIIDINGMIAVGADESAATNRRITYSRTEEHRTAQAGRLVTISDSNEVQLAGDGDDILGRLESAESDGLLTVVIGAQVIYLPVRGPVTAGDRLVGTQGTTASTGDYGYARPVEAIMGDIGSAPTQANFNDLLDMLREERNARAIALESSTQATGQTSDIRCILRLG